MRVAFSAFTRATLILKPARRWFPFKLLQTWHSLTRGYSPWIFSVQRAAVWTAVVLLALMQKSMLLPHCLIHDVASHKRLWLSSTWLRIFSVSKLLLRCADINVVWYYIMCGRLSRRAILFLIVDQSRLAQAASTNLSRIRKRCCICWLTRKLGQVLIVISRSVKRCWLLMVVWRLRRS